MNADSWSWRGLVLFWTVIVVVVGVVGLALAVLGPPGSRVAMRGGAVAYHGNNAGWPAPPSVARRLGAAVAAPDARLLEPARDFPGFFLPHKGDGGRRSAVYYAAFSNAADPQAKVGLIVSGMGLDHADSLAAVGQLPAAVDFAFSAYADAPGAILSAARNAGHEYLESLPMEPAGSPSNDEGPHALLTTATPAENARNLEWALSRIQGYAGVTGASDGQRGERFGESPALMGTLADEFGQRGLFYIDPRPDAESPDRVAGTGVDLVIDDSPAADDIDSKLAELEQAAHQHGSAIGLVGRPTPTTIARIVAWSQGLAAHGISLIPVSALVLQPAHAP